MAEGIRVRHRRGCAARNGGECSCKPGYEAWAYSKREGKKKRKTFARLAEAKLWRADATKQLTSGGMRVGPTPTVSRAWEAWHEGAKSGTVRNRSGDRYKPSAIRAYEKAMRLRVLPEFGQVRLADLHRGDLQDYVERLGAAGLSASTIQVTLLPLRGIYRRGLARGELAVNPCTGLQMPAVTGGRERFATPQEAEQLVAGVPGPDRPIWTTAMYAGVRRGELMALRCEDIDLAAGVIRVERNWDAKEGVIDLKSKAGRRRVPIIGALRDALDEHRLRSDREEGLLFGATAERPFEPGSLTKRADRAWRKAKLERITLHECRHTFASLMIAAGVNAKALSTFMGHANISITLDRYGHLMPGSEAEAAGLLDSYLAAERSRAEEAGRRAGAEPRPRQRTGEPV